MKKEKKIIKEYLKENIKQEYLPVKLVRRINEDIFNNNDFEYRTKNNFLRCIGTIYFKQVHEHYGLEGYVPTGAAYWKKIFGGDYRAKVIKPLIELGIIEFKDFGFQYFSYKSGNSTKGKETGSVGIRYRINPKLTSDDNPELTNDDKFTTINYISKSNASILTAEECILNGGSEFEFEPIPDKDFLITIDKAKASKWVEDNARNICRDYLNIEFINELPEDYVIEYRYFLDGLSYNTKFSTIKSAKLIAALHDKQLFFLKDAFYLGDIDSFLKFREDLLKYHYKREISKIGVVPIINKRSQKTLRITNYLVNFPSKILQFININNCTVIQLDLRTSQFLLFANLLNIYINKGDSELLSLFKKKQTRTFLTRLIKVLNEHKKLLPKSGVDLNSPNNEKLLFSDVQKFIQDVFYDDFYSVIQKKLNFSERGFAKLVLFKLLFKKNIKSDALINRLKEHYPTVMSLIESFKQQDAEKQSEGNNKNKVDDSSNFSVFLQCVESEIFIDNILIPLREKGIPCFSRHDSIVVASGYEDEVESFAKDVFKRFGFRYNHKVEDKFWEVVDFYDLEDSGYMDWLADEDILNSDYYGEISSEEPLEDNEANNGDMNYMDDLNDYEIEVCIKLRDIGVQEDYYEYVDADFLEDISNLPLLTISERKVINDDIVNLRAGYNFLQDKTNELLHKLVDKLEELCLP